VSTPDWSKAPEGASHWGPDNANWHGVWTKKMADGWQGWIDGKWCCACHLPEIRVNQMIPIPTQWRGPQDGLPPVGAEVEIRSGKEWYKAKVIAHGIERGANIAILQADDWIAVRGSDAEGVRPIQSDRDRAIEEMLKVMRDADTDDIFTTLFIGYAVALLDAGYRKT